MSQEFVRRVDGYNRPFQVNGNPVLARNAWLSLNCWGGPGRIETIRYISNDIVTTTTWQNTLKITLDGTVFLNQGLDGVMADWSITTLYGPIGGGGAYTIGTAKSTAQWLLNMDYEVSALVELQNNSSPNPNQMGLTVIGRVGR